MCDLRWRLAARRLRAVAADIERHSHFCDPAVARFFAADAAAIGAVAATLAADGGGYGCGRGGCGCSCSNVCLTDQAVAVETTKTAPTAEAGAGG